MWFKRQSKPETAQPEETPVHEAMPVRPAILQMRLQPVAETNIYNTPNMLKFPKRRHSGRHRSRH